MIITITTTTFSLDCLSIFQADGHLVAQFNGILEIFPRIF